jgi:hypothetical protein
MAGDQAVPPNKRRKIMEDDETGDAPAAAQACGAFAVHLLFDCMLGCTWRRPHCHFVAHSKRRSRIRFDWNPPDYQRTQLAALSVHFLTLCHAYARVLQQTQVACRG